MTTNNIENSARFLNVPLLMRLSPIAVLAAVLVSQSALAGPLAFAEASSELHDGKPKTYVYNAIDGKEKTVWCSQDGPNQEKITFGFSKPTKVTSFGIRLVTRGDEVDDSKASPKSITISDGSSVLNMKVRKSAKLQKIELNPGLRGQYLSIQLDELRGPDAVPVCISEIVLKSGSKLLTGSVVHRKLRSINTPSRRLLHSWIDNPEVPERSLTFHLDGTFRYEFSPALEGKPKVIKGKWRSASRRKILLTSRGKSYSIKKELSLEEGTLTLHGEKLHESLDTTLRVAPTTYP